MATDWMACRRAFPVLREWAYFGWASVAPLAVPVVEAMQGQLAGMRDRGALGYRDWYAAYDRARALAAELLGALPAEIALLKNTSEGLATVAHGLEWKQGDNLVLPAGEFPANAYPWLALAERGVEVRRVPLNSEGGFTPADVEAKMDARTRLLSVSFVNYLTGFRADLKKLGALCEQRGVFFCVDAIQGLGALPLDVRTMRIDALAADGHKWLCGPEGQAILFVRRKWLPHLKPLALGWWGVKNPARYDLDDQELCSTARRYECGTLNTVGVYGLAAALEFIKRAELKFITARLLDLARLLAEGLRAKGMRVDRANAAANQSGIVSFSCPGRPSRELAEALEQERIFVNPRGERLRAAVHAWNDERDIERLVEALPDA
ncbi:MAG: aminotransferase class V-fold PLP-dependent enzyme [Planctomycetota bacterium]|nr:aminotransferase class V-fold PLP-dependent enzyme [Planctomycetota bacterium]